METPHDDTAATPYDASHINTTDLGSVISGGQDSQLDVSSATSVFVQGDDGSMIYRSFRVREAKVCETAEFPLGAVPKGTLQNLHDQTHDVLDDHGFHDDKSEPPGVFCEMQELIFHAGRQNFEWHETTRWMFYEETVERPGDRWSKPHVPSLPAASVFDFRNCLTAGTIVLNLDASSFEELADMIGDILIATNQLSPGAKPEFLSILHLRHLHHFEYQQPLSASLKRLCKTTKVNLVSGTSPRSPKLAADSHVHVDIHDDMSNPDRIHKVNAQFRRYVPRNAMAASILVGEVSALKSQLTVFVRLARPLYVGDLTEVDVPIKFMCILLGPASSAKKSSALDPSPLATMGRVFGALLSSPAFIQVALKAENREGLMAAFDAVVDRSTLLPAESWDPEVRLAPISFPPQSRHSSAQVSNNRQTMRILPTAEAQLDVNLMRTGQLFGGLLNDIQRKGPHYVADFVNCLNLESCLTSGIMLLTTLTWLLVFSSIYESMTDNQIGAAETLFGACISGLIFYMFAGQPLTVIGPTASLFVFEWVLYAFATSASLSYVSFHFWVIFWTCVVLFIVVMFDLSAIVCYFTRFSQEIFSAFIASVVIYESIASLVRIQNQYPLNDDRCVCAKDPELFTDESTCRVRSIATCHHLIGCKIAGNCSQPNSFLLSCLLFCLTYIIISKFKSFRSSLLLPNKVRVVLGNFALPLTVVILTIFAKCIGIEIPKLRFSPLRHDGSFATTDESRGFVVDPGMIPAWGVFTAALISIPCSLLILMDQHFAAVIVNRRENRLKHGCGYHLDIVAVSLTLVFSAIFGLPMFAGVVLLSYANVVSLQHTPSAAKESKVGYSPKHFSIREQRVSSIVFSILLGFCLLLRGVFSQIPVAVLYGVFFYIGLAMLTGTQFWHRFKLAFIPIKYQPDYKFLRYIELIKVHVFTALQLFLFIFLWIVAIIVPIGFLFPLGLIIIALVRRLLTFGFAREELLRLDALVLPLNVIFHPGDLDEFREDLKEHETPQGASIRKGGKKIVANVKATLGKTIEDARQAIRKTLPSTSQPAKSESDGEYYDDETLGTPEKPARQPRHRQPSLNYSDEIEEVQTASVMGSPSSNRSSVYPSATAVTGSPKTTPRQATPPTKSEAARLLSQGERDDEPVLTTINVAEFTPMDEEFDADGEETMLGVKSGKSMNESQ